MAIQAKMPTQAGSALPTTGADLMALLTGKPVDARVLTATLAGLTQLLLGTETIKLALPTAFPAGTMLTLQIKDGQLQVQPQAQLATPSQSPSSNTTVSPSPNPQATTLAFPSVIDIATGRPVSVPVPTGNAMPMTPQASPPPTLSPATALQAQLQAGLLASQTPAAAAPPAGPALPPTNSGNAGPLPATLLLSPQPPLANAIPSLGGTTQMPASGIPVAVALSPTMSQPGSAPPKADGLGALLTNLAVLESRLTQFPAPVAAAARQFLAQQINLARGRLTGERLQQAMVGAGIFTDGAEDAEPGAPLRPTATETLKNGLMDLRKAVLAWVGPERAAAAALLVPPPRGGPPRAAALDPMPLLPIEAPEEIARTLLEQADTALGRLRAAHSHAPEHATRQEPGSTGPRQEWAGQVPMFLGQEAGLAQFQVSRDGGGASAAGQRSWQVRFAINFSVIGEVGAHVLLRGKRASVTLWAEREDTAGALDAMLPELLDGLTKAGLEAGSLQCRQGAPRAAPIATGGLVDSVS